jgi:hypothetical protein
LRDEINGTVQTLGEPLVPGITTAYLAQSDPYFATLKDWGKAIYDLWLHNGGCPPVLMASIGTPVPCTAPATPTGLTATGAKKSVKLSWSPVGGAAGYKVYYYQSGKYTLRATVPAPTGNPAPITVNYTDSGLLAGQTYIYAVTAYANCSGGIIGESGYSQTELAKPTR